MIELAPIVAAVFLQLQEENEKLRNETKAVERHLEPWAVRIESNDEVDPIQLRMLQHRFC